MKKIIQFIISFFCFTTISFAQNKDYAFTALPFTSVKLTDNFWLPRIKINHTVTIPASFERCEKTGRVKNFDMAFLLMIPIFIKPLKVHLFPSVFFPIKNWKLISIH
jgi:hypothetical protein